MDFGWGAADHLLMEPNGRLIANRTALWMAIFCLPKHKLSELETVMSQHLDQMRAFQDATNQEILDEFGSILQRIRRRLSLFDRPEGS